MHGELLEDWEHEEGHRKYEEDGGVHEELLENGEHQHMLEDVEVVLVELVHDTAGAGVAVGRDGGQEGGHGDCEAAVDAQEADMQVQVLVQVQGVQRGDPRDTAEPEGGDGDGDGDDGEGDGGGDGNGDGDVDADDSDGDGG